MASVKRGRPLVGAVLRLLPATGFHTTSAKVRSVVVFIRHLHILFRNNGAKGACLILKVYAVTLQQSLGGHVVKDLTELKFRVSRTNGGIPRCIPVQHRQMIRSGNYLCIRFYLSVFNLYRVIDFKGDTRFNSLVKTIVSPAKVLGGFANLKASLLNFIPVFYKLLAREIGQNPRSLQVALTREYKGLTPQVLLKSSPFTRSQQYFEGMSRDEQRSAMQTEPVVSTHPLAVHEAANALENNAELNPCIHYFLGLLPENHDLRRIFYSCLQIPLSVAGGLQRRNNPVLGKLSLKNESAGKVRVFAIVDPWTQWLLKPLHDTIFDEILGSIYQDGTKDQMAPVYSLLKRDPSSLFSLDLSAATDRLPIWLQEAILGEWLGAEYARNWASLLVDRDYQLKVKGPYSEFPIRHKVRYSVGQPMGALSSWAMLALTHHFIVQFSAYSVYGNRDWFPLYAILGDDIVIGDAKVAKTYLRVMRILGVGIGLHKSLISGAGSALEFAKRTIFRGIDVSPISLTELQAALLQPASAVVFIQKYGLTLAGFLKVAGFGYRVLGNLHAPLSKLNSKVRLLVLALNIPKTVEDVSEFFEIGKPKSGKALFETFEVITAMVDKEFKLMKAALNKARAKIMHTEYLRENEVQIAKALMARSQPVIPLSAEDAELLQSVVEETRDWLKVIDGGVLTPDHQEFITDGFKMVQSSYLRFLDKEESTGSVKHGVLYWLDMAYSMRPAAETSSHISFMGYSGDFRHSSYLRTVHLTFRGKGLAPSLRLVRDITAMLHSGISSRVLNLAQAISDSLVSVMLQKYDLTAAEMYMELIRLSHEIGALPMASLEYTRIIDAQERGFSEGMHIRLWKALSGLAQGTKRGAKPQNAPKEFTGWSGL